MSSSSENISFFFDAFLWFYFRNQLDVCILYGKKQAYYVQYMPGAPNQVQTLAYAKTASFCIMSICKTNVNYKEYKVQNQAQQFCISHQMDIRK